MVFDTIAIAFWPAVVGLGLLGWLRRDNLDVLSQAWVAAALILVSGVIYVVFFDITSLLVLLDLLVGLILFGTLCILTVYGCTSRLTRRQCIGVSLFGIMMIGQGGHMLVGDHVLERQIVEGVVRQLRVHETARGPNEYRVTIGDQTFEATTRLFATLRQGDRMRASIGRGSGYIYGIEKL